MPFKWESAEYESVAETSPNMLGGNLGLVAIRATPKTEPVYLTRGEMTALAWEWLDYLIEDANHERAAALLAAWGEIPHAQT